MRYLQIALAVLLTVALLFVARNTSRGRPEFVTNTENGVTLEMTTVPKAPENNKARLEVRVVGGLDSSLALHFHQPTFGQDLSTPRYRWRAIKMMPVDSTTDLYYTEVSTGPRGGRTWFYFEVRDGVGGRRATLPRKGDEPFTLKYIGAVPPWVIGPHIFLMFATVFCVALAAIYGCRLMRSGGDVHPMAFQLFLAALFAFLGGYPFGWGMNYYAFDVVWEGVPFGTDATDNKTQLLFVYYLFMVLATWRSLNKGKRGRDIYSPQTLGRFGVGAFVLTLAIYLIPHSIQFSPESTKAVCWSFIGAVAAVYLFGWIRTMKNSSASGTGKPRKRARAKDA